MTHVQRVVVVQQQQIIGQSFGRFKIGDVDVGMRRGELRIVGASVDDGHHVAAEGAVELFSDVIRAKRVFCRDIKLVGVEHHVAFVTHERTGETIITARSVNVHLDVIGELREIFLSHSVRVFVRAEPGDQFLLLLQPLLGSGERVHQLRRRFWSDAL